MVKANEIAGIECGGPVATAVWLILESRIEEMFRLRTRALDFNDPEGVHDMRVASRRLRSALRDFARHLPKSKLSVPIKQLREIADKLGVVRDLDVAIIALERMLATVTTTEIASGMQRLIAAEKAKLDPARKELSRAITIKAIRELKSAFLQAVEASIVPPSSEETGLPQAVETSIVRPSTEETRPRKSRKGTIVYKVFARATLLKRLKELEKLSLSLYEPQRVKPLHKMRIAAKRLRYALDLFAQCWGESLGVFSRQVAQLQSSLGELHDCDLWIEQLGKRLRRIKTKRDEQATPQDERDAMIWLLSHFSRLRTRHYRAALARWHECEAKDFCNRLSATLRT